MVRFALLWVLILLTPSDMGRLFLLSLCLLSPTILECLHLSSATLVPKERPVPCISANPLFPYNSLEARSALWHTLPSLFVDPTHQAGRPRMTTGAVDAWY